MFEKIEQSEISRLGMVNVSTTPTKKTPFGESNFTAADLKGRFDKLPDYLAKRLNEIFEGMQSGELAKNVTLSDGSRLDALLLGLFDGETAKKIKIVTPSGDVTLAEISSKMKKALDEMESGEYFKEALNFVIENVYELPKAEISRTTFYRVPDYKFVLNKQIIKNSTFHYFDSTTDELPKVGEVVTDASLSFLNVYYEIRNDAILGYVDEGLAASLGFSKAGWRPLDDLLQTFGLAFGGWVSTLDDPLMVNSFLYVLGEYDVYCFDGVWHKVSFDDVSEILSVPSRLGKGYWVYAYNKNDLENGHPAAFLASHGLNDDFEDQIPVRHRGLIKCATPVNDEDCANKGYVDDLGEAVMNGLDAILSAQKEILGGSV